MKRLRLNWPFALVGLLAALLLLGLPGQVSGQEINQATPTQTVHIFFSGGCADCWPYLEETLLPVLETVNLAAQAG